jgi:hypothetical protein
MKLLNSATLLSLKSEPLEMSALVVNFQEVVHLVGTEEAEASKLQ